MPGDRPGERRAAQPSGRPHEPSGDRRPQMDDHPRPSAQASDGTELGLQTALADIPSPVSPAVARPGRRSRREVVESAAVDDRPAPERQDLLLLFDMREAGVFA